MLMNFNFHRHFYDLPSFVTAAAMCHNCVSFKLGNSNLVNGFGKWEGNVTIDDH
jgi:hypothetical protein